MNQALALESTGAEAVYLFYFHEMDLAAAAVFWSSTPGGERWVPVLLAAVENPVFPWLAGTLLACAAGVAIPMAWMEA